MEKIYIERDRYMCNVLIKLPYVPTAIHSLQWGGSLDNDVVNIKHFQVIE